MISSTGFYRCCAPAASAPVMVKNQSPSSNFEAGRFTCPHGDQSFIGRNKGAFSFKPSFRLLGSVVLFLCARSGFGGPSLRSLCPCSSFGGPGEHPPKPPFFPLLRTPDFRMNSENGKGIGRGRLSTKNCLPVCTPKARLASLTRRSFFGADLSFALWLLAVWQLRACNANSKC